jgi:DNA-directed RNA polymerase specialized sigma24 family protein
MSPTKQIAQPRYATNDDFERIFEEEMNSLYLLSFLLTADQALAEQCFVSGLKDAVKGNPVFKEWARSWAERMIIQNAVRAVNPRPAPGLVESPAVSADREELRPHHRVFAAILDLDTFARFVYVVTVLERYSDQDCSVLLGCARREVLSARVRALQQIGSITSQPNNPAGHSSPEKTTLRDLTGSAIGWLITPPLATSA